jgi:CubicO group peptidase (beta-lactamase class C family)
MALLVQVPEMPAMRRIVQAALVVLVSAVSGSAGTQARLSDSERAAVEAAVREAMERLRAPGLSLAIARDGEIALAAGFGLANVEREIPATERTLYRTASLAKPITATAVMQLVEQRRIDLDAPVQRYCPAFPEKRWPVTTRHLLGHTSGVRHPEDAEDEQTKHYDTITAALPLFAPDRLLHEPGTRTLYSTFGYMVLACAIEGASGTSYMAWVTSHVFDIAGMPDTTPDTVSYDDPRRAAGYRVRGRSRQPSLRVDTSFKLAAGGLVSNVTDLARFAIATMDGRLVAPATRELMWTPVRLNDGTATALGLGWQPSTSGGRTAIIATGQQDEVTTLLVLFPARRGAIVLMSNLERSVQQFVPLLSRLREAAGLD